MGKSAAKAERMRAMNADNDDFRGPIPAWRVPRVDWQSVWCRTHQIASNASDHAGDVFVISAVALLAIAAGWL